MRRATVRAAQAGLSLALLVALAPLSAAHAQSDPSAPPASIEQQGGGATGGGGAAGGQGASSGQNATTGGQTAGGGQAPGGQATGGQSTGAGQATGAGQTAATGGGQSATGTGQTAGGGQTAAPSGTAAAPAGAPGGQAAPSGAQAAPAGAPGGQAAPSGGQAAPAAAPAGPAAAPSGGQATAGAQAGPGVSTGVAGEVPPGGATAQGTVPTGAPRQAPAIVYGFFRDPLWPGPGQRFIAADCAIGVGATIIHYCPSLPPLAEAITLPDPILPPAVLQCGPWFQYFPTCRRPMDPAP